MNFVKFFHSALQKPVVRRSVQAFIGTPFLVGLLLVLTEQLRWLPSPWPMTVIRVLFGILFGIALVCFVIFMLFSAFQIWYLRRRKATHENLDGMKILQRVILTPAIYLLAALWAWAWLGSHSPRRYGAAMVNFFVFSNVVGFSYYMVKAFRQARAIRAARATGTEAATPHDPGGGRRITPRRLQFSLMQFAWEVWWKAFRKRRLSPLDRVLCQAVIRGNVNNVEVFLQRGADANLRLLYGYPLLVIAAGAGKEEIVRLLLNAGANVNAASSWRGLTALTRAATKGHYAVVQFLLERGAAVDAATDTGMTPLLLAANESHSEIARTLLAHGANANAATKRGMTPLMLAARRGSAETVQVLLSGGADMDLQSRSGLTALQWAERGHHEAAAMLLRQRQGSQAGGAEKGDEVSRDQECH